MRFKSFILLLGAFLVLPAWAKTCDWEWNSVAPKNQEELDTKLKDCTKILGYFKVSQNYNGSLVVNGVTNMTGRIMIWDHPEMTEVVWNDLEFLTELSIYKSTALRSIYMPKLATAGEISVTFNHRLDLDLPVLTYAESISLGGAFSRFNAPLLFNVSAITVWLRPLTKYYNGPFETIDAFNFSLPSLEYIGSAIYLKSNLSAIILPKLKSIFAPGIKVGHIAGVSGGTSEIAPNPVRDISLPSLIYANELSIKYDQSLSLPLLEQALELNLQGNSSKVILPALWNATRIYVKGKVTDVSFPALIQNHLISILTNGRTKTDCTNAKSDWERSNSPERISANATCRTTWSEPCPSFQCLWANPKPPRGPLTSGEISGICAGILVMLVLIYTLFRWWRHSKKQKKAKEVVEKREREMEMDALTIIGDRESITRMVVEGAVAGRRDSKETIVVVDVEERSATAQRSG